MTAFTRRDKEILFNHEHIFRGVPLESFSYDPLKKSIICMGCSHTFGDGLSKEDTWVHKLNNNLQDHEAFSMGFPGHGLKTIRNHYNLLIRDKYVPDIVILQTTSLDRDYDLSLFKNPRSSYNLFKYRENPNGLLTKGNIKNLLKAGDTKFILEYCDIFPTIMERQKDLFVKFIDELILDGCHIILFPYVVFQNEHRLKMLNSERIEFYKWKISYCFEKGIDCIEPVESKSFKNAGLTHNKGNCHFNAAGSTIIADMMHDFIVKKGL